MRLPPRPTDEQIEAIALATIRGVFEDSATNLRDLTIPGDGTWSATYTASQTDFKVDWTGDEFTKSVLSVGV